jgi:hypothetical protein
MSRDDAETLERGLLANREDCGRNARALEIAQIALCRGALLRYLLRTLATAPAA